IFWQFYWFICDWSMQSEMRVKFSLIVLVLFIILFPTNAQEDEYHSNTIYSLLDLFSYFQNVISDFFQKELFLKNEFYPTESPKMENVGNIYSSPVHFDHLNENTTQCHSHARLAYYENITVWNF